MVRAPRDEVWRGVPSERLPGGSRWESADARDRREGGGPLEALRESFPPFTLRASPRTARAHAPSFVRPAIMRDRPLSLVTASVAAAALGLVAFVAVARGASFQPPGPSSFSRRALLGSGDVSAGESEGYAGGAFDRTTSANSSFVRKLIALARDARPTFAGDGDLLPLDAQASLCGSDFFRGVDGAGLSLAEVDEAYALAHPMHATGIVPVGCLRGCIIGGGVLETIARMYGVTRTLTPSSWRGKCVSAHLAQRPASLPSDAEWQPGLAVTNRIKVNYGGFINRLLGLDEPLRLYPGKVFAGASYFTPGEDALVVDYDGRDHEFSGFRDELREVYPGFYVGKMFALPGASLWDGALTVPEGDPAFAINFALFSPPGAEVATPPRAANAP